MTRILPDSTLSQISDYIALNLALKFPKARWDDLERNLVSAANEFGYKNTAEFIERIITTPLSREHIEILTAYLTINETYFWREQNTFDALENKILPELISARQNEKRIRIWSAGCSSGEEPYSIAIALHKLIPDISDWNITILATDISPRILKKAVHGHYSKWSFRNSPDWLKGNYFLPKENNAFEIIPPIKKMVKFDYLNLAEDLYPSHINDTNAMDIIYCRNVLMYFTDDLVKQVIRGLYNSLIEGGYLIVSASELSLLHFQAFNTVNIPGMILYQKTSGGQKTPQTAPVFKEETEPPVFEMPLIPAYTLEEPELPIIELEKEIPATVNSPVKINSRYQDAFFLYSQGSYDAVIGMLQKTDLKLDEQMLLIKASANQGKLLDALNSCKKAITAYKTEPRLHYLYAAIQLECSQIHEAVKSLKQAIFLDSDFVLSYYSLGNIYFSLGDVKSAKKCFENVLLILAKYNREDILLESGGLTVGRFKEIVNAKLQAQEVS